MGTFLFSEIIFGPVQSRRLGSSLGINLLSPEAKICNFDCIYCECGWTNLVKGIEKFVKKDAVFKELEEKLLSIKETDMVLDYITFAGNGEPTLHPKFDEVIEGVVDLRDRLAPKSKISVLSNATTLNKRRVLKALEKVDKKIMKLDAGNPEDFQLIDKPMGGMSLDKIIHSLNKLEGYTIQAMFLRGSYEGRVVDNTKEPGISQWISQLNKLKPKEVMLYSIDRDTPLDTLERVSQEELEVIAARVNEIGLRTMVA